MGIFSRKPSRKPSQKPTMRTGQAPVQNNKFQSVTVTTSGLSCKAARALAGRRFLCAEAPLLPLAGCDRAGSCECRYQRFSDRREGPRRGSEGALPTPGHGAPLGEQRGNQGRRAEERGLDGESVPWLR